MASLNGDKSTGGDPPFNFPIRDLIRKYLLYSHKKKNWKKYEYMHFINKK